MTSWRPRRGSRPGRRRWAGLRGDSGNALIEFVFLGILAMVPLVYLVVAVSTVQRNAFAVTQAAREAGRAYATADTEDQGAARARYAVQLALADQGVSSADVTVSYVPASAACGPTGGDSASLQPGAEFTVCVQRSITVPGVPSVLDAHRNTVTGRFIVHVDDYRDSS